MPYHIKTPSVLNPTIGDVYYKGGNAWTDLYDDRKVYENEADAKTNPQNFYTAANGEVYELKIRIDQNSPKIAPRRFAVAIDKFDVEILKGPKSFSSSTKVLLDELKFRLDNQLP